jgi:hypothetical protein
MISGGRSLIKKEVFLEERVESPRLKKGGQNDTSYCYSCNVGGDDLF